MSPHVVKISKQQFKFSKIILLILKKIDLTPERLDAAKYYFYTANNYGEMAEEVAENGNNEENGQIGTFQWELPTAEFEGLWENLIYEVDDCPKQKVYK